ncbi:MAG: hypothetical protein DMF69_13855 [Acidobacteria bacterium]|nr:MAG: hypothetical protein DMF69_13855 [Acidobacteriota bacterium]
MPLNSEVFAGSDQTQTKLMKESEQMMTRYLLGELSESEQSVLEKEYFTDPQFFDQMLKIENELVDDYVRGRLSKEVRGEGLIGLTRSRTWPTRSEESV